MTLPKVSFTVDDRAVDIEGWSCNAVRNRGFDNFRGVVKEKDALRMGQGSILTARVDANQVLWEGRIALDPFLSEGKASITASGFRAMVEKAAGRLFYQSRDNSILVDESAAPHSYTGYKQEIGMQIGAGIVSFSIGSGVALTGGDAHGFVIWTPNSTISRFALTYQANKNGWSVQSMGATGPDGTRTQIATDAMASGSGSIDRAIGGDYDLLALRCYDSTVTSPTTTEHVIDWTSLRINGIALGDTFSASEVVMDVGARVGYDTSGVKGNGLNVLPIDHRDQWVGLLDYMTLLTDWHWEVYENRGSGPLLVFDDWSDTWTVTKASDARLNLPSLEQFNRAITKYPTASGVPAEAEAFPATDPLKGRYTNTVVEELTDNQADATLAEAVAATNAERYAQTRYQGTIEVASAVDPAGRRNPYGLRPGLTASVADYGPMQDLALRVYEVEYRPDGVTLGIESPVSAAGLIANALLEKQRS